MGNRVAVVHSVFAAVVLLALLTTPCFSAPTVTWDIAVADGIKIYTYTLKNDEPWGEIHEFTVYMPEAGARAVIDMTSLGSIWSAQHGFYGDHSYWGMSGGLIDYGKSSTFYLRTPADVTTIYDYTISNRPSNWIYGLPGVMGEGDTSLPVPSGVVPEPSSILALLCGMGGLAGTMLRRRR